MPKKKDGIDYTEVARIATIVSDGLIATHGLKTAIHISKSIHEKTEAVYKSMKAKYPTEYE